MPLQRHVATRADLQIQRGFLLFNGDANFSRVFRLLQKIRFFFFLIEAPTFCAQ